MAKNYDELADLIMGQVGGKENVSFITHCMTRLRMNVKDRSIIDLNKIDELPDVIGSQWSADQLQIILGPKVADVYKTICDKYNFQVQQAVDENLDDNDGKKHKFSIGALFGTIASCLTPLIPTLIGAGLIKCILLVGEMLGWLTPEMPTYTVLTFVSDAGFYFLPVFIGGFAAKKFNANMGLGMLIGAMLIHPNFIAAVNEGTALSVFGLPITAATYSSSIFPALLAAYVMSYVEKFISKYSPESLRTILVPLCTLLVMTPLTLCLLAPIGSIIGVYLAEAIIWLYNVTGFFGVAVLGAIMPFVVMTGMHGAFVPYMFQSLATIGYEPIVCTGMIISNITQGIAALAVGFKTKNKNLKSTSLSGAITAVVGGVTEPALYGVNMKYKTPLYAAMIGNFCGALFGGLTKVYAYSFAGSSGILALTGFIGPEASNLINMVISVIIACVVTFIATFILYKDEKQK